MQATHAQLSPVFAEVDDAEQRISTLLKTQCEGQEPDFVGSTANDDVLHRCWRVQDQCVFETVEHALQNKEVFIADGHHRYTTALNYSKEHTDNALAQRCMFVLVPMQDQGLLVLPTHRVLKNLSGFSLDALRAALKDVPELDLSETGSAASLEEIALSLPTHGAHAMALYDGRSRQSYILRANTEDPLLRFCPDRPKVWRTLDVAVLHELFVDRVVRCHFGGQNVQYNYPHDLQTLKEQCEGENDRIGVILQATSLQQVCDVARAGDVMPPKSTFFFPKLATGLVINALK
ncbi:MAG: DUF1015 domain-containing protein [Myxococcales bacterium]|nr:MAG: DUF1015 domain-containing protein [Myxococcales bacterium]